MSYRIVSLISTLHYTWPPVTVLPLLTIYENKEIAEQDMMLLALRAPGNVRYRVEAVRMVERSIGRLVLRSIDG